MTTQSLRQYLSTKPALVASAASLAREHAVDTKTAIRLLKERSYALSPERGGWVYQPMAGTQAHTPEQLLALALEPYHLLAISATDIHKLVTSIPLSPPPLTSEDLEQDPERTQLAEWPKDSKEYQLNKLIDMILDDPKNSVRMVTIGLHFLLQAGKLPTRAHIAPDGAIRPYLTPHTTNNKADSKHD